MMQFMILFSRQGKLRLQKWYISYSEKEKKKILRDLTTIVLSRKPKMCSFIEWKDLKVVYRRHVHSGFIINVFSYASLYFCAAVEPQDNELLTLEIIHRYVELLDKYFGSVCELDIIFHFEKAYYVLDEFMLGGEVQETGKESALNDIDMQDLIQEEEAPQGFFEEQGILFFVYCMRKWNIYLHVDAHFI
ncbi:unnamed protein product [Schistosoma curassoni]|uniref:AP complex subunit sigma n=1 Tax=Schistosoma curassoni TaxID=6186 RepID=A0A183KN13_9TREM|nr:unnamed protein product [Schistosoma curassoni]VDP61567.1 unnamed protein product [Schistosoma curassoni]